MSKTMWYRVVRFGTRPKPVPVTEVFDRVVRVDGVLQEKNEANIRYVDNESGAWKQLAEWAKQNESRARRNVEKAIAQQQKIIANNLEGHKYE